MLASLPIKEKTNYSISYMLHSSVSSIHYENIRINIYIISCELAIVTDGQSVSNGIDNYINPHAFPTIGNLLD